MILFIFVYSLFYFTRPYICMPLKTVQLKRCVYVTFRLNIGFKTGSLPSHLLCVNTTQETG